MQISEPVPFVDLDRQHKPIEAELRGAFERVVARGDFVLGAELELFETEFADYVGTREAIAVNSGTAALAIALRATEIGPGDEVIVPAHTYIATALAVVHAGAVPVFCDVEELTGLVDVATAESLMSERTAAVIAVHLYGQVCDMDTVQEFANRHRIAVIEDAAQAHGASCHRRRAGSHGLASAFSFYPSKNLGALGDGGIVCTGDSGIGQRARRLRNLGQQAKGHHLDVGYNERLDTLQAAMLRVKLRHLDRWNEMRAAVAAAYRAHLPPEVRVLPERTGFVDVNHIFPIRVDAREQVLTALRDGGVGTGVHYSPPVHRQPPFRSESDQETVPLVAAERWAQEEISLPMFPGLREVEVVRVCHEVNKACTDTQNRGPRNESDERHGTGRASPEGLSDRRGRDAEALQLKQRNPQTGAVLPRRKLPARRHRTE